MGVGSSNSPQTHLSDAPRCEEVQFLAVSGEEDLGRVEHAEVGCTVDDDALHGDEEPSIETDRS